MSKIIASAAIRGARQIALEAEQFVERAKVEKGEDTKIGFCLLYTSDAADE